MKIKGESIFRRTVRQFKDWGLSKSLVLVVPESHIRETEEELSDLLEEYDRIVPGGETRHRSCLESLKSIPYDGNDIVLIHDVARPFITSGDIEEVVNGTLQFGSATLVGEIGESLVKAEGEIVSGIIGRDTAYLVKTPQGVHSSALQTLIPLEFPEGDPTDLCSWVLSIGMKPVKKLSNPFNIKITRREDLDLSEYILPLFEKYNH